MLKPGRKGIKMKDDIEPPLARPTDPWTSHAAIPEKERISRLQLLLLRTFDAAPRPLNAYEAEDRAGQRDHFWRRANELEKKGFVEVVGINTSPRSTKPCRTYVVTAYGKAFLKLKE
jgi:hypothetical protein